jgi:hypothetical protein
MPVLRTLLVALVIVSLAPAADFTTLVNGSEKKIAGDLISIDAKECVFKGPDGPAPTPLLEVVSIGFAPEPPIPSTPHVLVELTDGSAFRCKPDSITFQGQEVQFTLLSGPELKVPFKALSSIIKDAENAKVRDHSDLKAALKRLRDGDGVLGWSKARDALSELSGTFTGGTGKKIQFKMERGEAPIDFDANKNIQAFLFANKADLTRPPSTCRVVDAQRNFIMAGVVESKEGGDFEITLLTGQKITLPRAQVAILDYSKGRFDFLSELEPVIASEPLDDVLFRYRFYPPEEKDKRNKTLSGGALLLGTKKFDHGLCLPAPTVLIYDLNGEYKEFAAIVGIDDALAGNNRSRVRLLIEGLDANNQSTKIFEGDFDRSKPPLELRKVVKDVKKLRITVKSNSPLDLWNHLDIVDAKITK